MTVRITTVTEPLLELGMTLGEGLVWDTGTQRLYFVDIDERRVYTYEPSSGVVGYETFTGKISVLALTASGDGLVGTDEDGFVCIPSSSLPFPPSSSAKPREVVRLGPPTPLSAAEKRFNDGAVDPSGRFLAGTMGRAHSDVVGRVYSLSRFPSKEEYTVSTALEDATCTNGMGWSPDGRTLYFSDSWVAEIAAFNYDPATGALSHRRVFSKLPYDEFGEPDGLCMDAQGGVWSARWEAGLVLRFDPEGHVTDRIELPRTWNVTCVVFGGAALDDLYVTTADTAYNGAEIGQRDAGGSLFVVRGLGYTGLERTRFRDCD